MMGNGFGGFGFGIPGLVPILVWVLIILVVVWLVRTVAGRGPDRGKSAQQILDERFARGEIDRQEYEEKRKLLG
jgi:putative membrane protein